MSRFRSPAPIVLILLMQVIGCDAEDGEFVSAVVCGEPHENLWNLYDIQALDGCTRFRGSIHVSDTGLVDLQSLPDLRAVDGSYTFFRNDALLRVDGLEDLEVVGGKFGFGTHALLSDLSGLSGLRSVGGDFYIRGESVHPDDAMELADQIDIGGSIEISGSAPR